MASSALSFELRQLALGTAYWLRPSRVRHLTGLILGVTKDVIAPPPPLPGPHSIRNSPPGFAGLARTITPDNVRSAAAGGFYPQGHIGAMKWWSPPVRAVMALTDVHIAKRFRRTMRGADVEISFDRDFSAVLDKCAAPRPGRPQLTWITPKAKALYMALHAQGHAHSVEVRNTAGELVGGLFGLAVGPVFSALSMFHTEDNASKYAIVSLYHHVAEMGFVAVDHQHMSPWVEALGGTNIPRDAYLALLASPVANLPEPGPWQSRFSATETANWQPTSHS